MLEFTVFNFEEALEDLKKDASKRELKVYSKRKNDYRTVKKERYINFSSNDYFQLSENTKLIESSKFFLEKYGAGSCASQLVTGHIEPLALARKKIKAYKKAPDALIFSSGFMANLGAMRALSEAGATFYFDQFSHASLIDGVLSTKSKWNRFRHNDADHLKALLEKDNPAFPVIVVEAIYSMQGDRARLGDLYELAKKGDGLLYVDEAHAVGVFNDSLSNLDPTFKFKDFQHLMFMGAFGKALGGFGAYICGDVPIIQWIVNKARTLIYSTALPPAVLGAMIASIEWIENHPDAGKSLLEKTERWRSELEAPMVDSNTQIISILTEKNERTLDLQSHLMKDGLLGVAIRPPTVSPNTGRIRLAINLGHSLEDLGKLKESIEAFF